MNSRGHSRSSKPGLHLRISRESMDRSDWEGLCSDESCIISSISSITYTESIKHHGEKNVREHL